MALEWKKSVLLEARETYSTISGLAFLIYDDSWLNADKSERYNLRIINTISTKEAAGGITILDITIPTWHKAVRIAESFESRYSSKIGGLRNK
jgi:hypothetical protein